MQKHDRGNGRMFRAELVPVVQISRLIPAREVRSGWISADPLSGAGFEPAREVAPTDPLDEAHDAHERPDDQATDSDANGEADQQRE